LCGRNKNYAPETGVPRTPDAEIFGFVCRARVDWILSKQKTTETKTKSLSEFQDPTTAGKDVVLLLPALSP
jgi:hypothetical protein